MNETPVGASEEIQLADTIWLLLRKENIEAHILKGHRLDCGSKLGYVKAFIEYSLKNPQFQKDVKNYLITYLRSCL